MERERAKEAERKQNNKAGIILPRGILNVGNFILPNDCFCGIIVLKMISFDSSSHIHLLFNEQATDRATDGDHFHVSFRIKEFFAIKGSLGYGIVPETRDICKGLHYIT